MQGDGARAPLNPVIVWVAIGVVVLVAVGIGFAMLRGPGGEFQKGGSEQHMQNVQSGGKLYEPPAVALPPSARMGGGRSGGSSGSMPYGLPPGPPPVGPTGTPPAPSTGN